MLKTRHSLCQTDHSDFTITSAVKQKVMKLYSSYKKLTQTISWQSGQKVFCVSLESFKEQEEWEGEKVSEHLANP